MRISTRFDRFLFWGFIPVAAMTIDTLVTHENQFREAAE